MTILSGPKTFAEMLYRYGVTHAFFVPTCLLPALAEMEKLGIKTVSAHGEKAAAYMADGYARVSGRPGICLAQTVGASNLAAGLKDAYLSASPVIALTGGPYLESRYRHVYQEARDAESFAGVTKWQASVETPGRMPELLRQAFRMATCGCPGPVFLELRGHMGQVIESDTEFDGVVEHRFAKLPPFRPEPDRESVREALDALEVAARPVLVVGGGTISSGAEEEVAAFAEMLQIPVVTSFAAKACLPENHPLYVGVVGHYSRSCANRLVSEADLVFFIGSHTGSMVTNNWRIPSVVTQVIQLDIEPSELGRHYAGQVSLNGDAKAGLARLMEMAHPRRNPGWVLRAQELRREWAAEADLVLTSKNVPIRPERLCAELSDALPADAALVVDTLQASIWAATMIALKGPSQRLARCAGSLGWALPGGIGAKFALGDRPVVVLTGDGGIYYHLAELETAARYGLNLVVVVNNNGAYAGEKSFWDAAYGEGFRPEAYYASWRFGNIGFAQVARDLGCSGIRVEEPGEIAPAIKKALASSGPTVVDVVTDPEAVHAKGWTPGG